MTADLFPPIVALGASAILAGLLAGRPGVGGGIVLVPVLFWILSATVFAPEITMHMAVATSLATILFASVCPTRAHDRRGAAFGFPIALPATLRPVISGQGVPGRPPLSLGHVNRTAAVILPFSTAEAPVGARLAHWVNPVGVRCVFAVFLLLTAIRMPASVWS